MKGQIKDLLTFAFLSFVICQPYTSIQSIAGYNATKYFFKHIYMAWSLDNTYETISSYNVFVVYFSPFIDIYIYIKHIFITIYATHNNNNNNNTL